MNLTSASCHLFYGEKNSHPAPAGYLNVRFLGNIVPVTIQEKMSWVPFQIELMYEKENLGIGTAFAYQLNNQTYLITNWHNVSGRHPETLKAIHKDLALPNKLINI